MDQVTLPNGRITTRLGFGCSRLMGGYNLRESQRLISAARDAGITHFDVAPSYGMGTAEDVLGQSFAGRWNEITVTTKVGIGRPPAQSFMSLARRALHPILSIAPALKQRLGRRAYLLAQRSQFGVEDMRRSLEESLRRLRIERVDVLLLHQIGVGDLNDGITRFLEDCCRKGMIGTYGIGTSRIDANAIATAAPELARIVQTDWNVTLGPMALQRALFLITHGALRPLAALAAWLAANPDRSNRLRDMLGPKTDHKMQLSRLILSAATANNASGIVLVSSADPARIRMNAAVTEDRESLRAGEQFWQLLRTLPDVPQFTD